jgi:hypothetical protein
MCMCAADVTDLICPGSGRSVTAAADVFTLAGSIIDRREVFFFISASSIIKLLQVVAQLTPCHGECGSAYVYIEE